jgi:glycosyltransferase involved in cell wall biosynthesis
LTPKIQYSVVIPVFRSSHILADLLEQLTCQMDKLGQLYEIIFIEDNGGDDSWEILCALLPKYPRVRILKMMRNFGQHNAIMCGFAHSKGEMVITMDDDLQNPPEEINKLIARINEGYDIVYGVPIMKRHHPVRNIGSFLVRTLYKKIFALSVNPTSFRIIRRKVVEGIVNYDKNFTYIDGLIAWHTTNVGEVGVRHDTREAGRSSYSVRKLFVLAMNMLTNFSIMPLQAVSALGLIFSTVGFFLTVAYLVKYLVWGVPVPGYTSIIIGITMFSGVQMLSLGLIGEYLGRIHLNINSKPQYFVSEDLSSLSIYDNKKYV